LIESNPRAAIEKAFPAELQNRLPASRARLLEKRIGGSLCGEAESEAAAI
jgi:hypothetical protein